MAIATASLSVLVFSSDYWKKGDESGARALPLIDVETLLSALTPSAVATAATADEPFYSFDARSTVEIDGVTHKIQIQISAEPEAVASGPPPQSQDFAITGLETELPVAHLIVFNLINAQTGEVVPAIWRGYLNATPTNLLGPSASMMAGVKRKRFQTMAD
jgi:hypothetical protein